MEKEPLWVDFCMILPKSSTRANAPTGGENLPHYCNVVAFSYQIAINYNLVARDIPCYNQAP